MGEAGRRAPSSEFGYGEAQGSSRLREVVAGYLRRVRGAVAEPQLMVISSGFAQGLALVLGALATDERHVVREARARSIGLYGMSHYRIDAATHPPQLVMGFGHLTEGAIDRGIATIADLLR